MREHCARRGSVIVGVNFDAGETSCQSHARRMTRICDQTTACTVFHCSASREIQLQSAT